ncbi:MAG TPA: hypothetical protein PKE27_10770 [Povalibacter sp.]|uniref:hypothetical protein n=1 Tax=Povalibacter sp. TaxID=1962978 RepID=UPI002C4F07C7|nr:hypothetical protein [Povalibacter sp.]HMN45049.1 hypothetical protein [Povalibacter sp.]
MATACAVVALVGGSVAEAGTREQAKRMFDRLTGTAPTPDQLESLTAQLDGGSSREAVAFGIIDPANATSSGFYRVVLKNFATPWTNRDQTAFAPLNDYTATVIGMVRDNKDFRGVLSDDIVYVGAGVTPAYSLSSNAHYEALERSNADLRLSTVLQERTQSSLNGTLPPSATAGIITSRAAAEAFFIDGTNRAMFRFTLLNHLCRDLEQVHDVTRPPDRIRQDIARSPGGDSSVYLNNCIGCHNGMDPLAQAFAYYDFDENQGRLVYTPNVVQPKYLINSDNFKPGYVTTNDSWENRWRLPGPNTLLGWSPSLPGSGAGAKSLGEELAHSEAFAQCQVEKVFRTICFRSPSNADDHDNVVSIATSFRNENGGNLRRVFAQVAAHCAGE